jgi:hypothetical protein
LERAKIGQIHLSYKSMMNGNLLSRVWVGLAGTLAVASLTTLVTTTTHQPAYARGGSFYCGKSQGVPTTLARTRDGQRVVIVRWTSINYFGDKWSPQQRCQVVSQRFQRSNDNGTLKNITTGNLNGQSAVCTGNPCTSRNLLFTLKKGTNEGKVLRRLLDRRGLARGNALSESADGSINLDFETYLNNATVEAQ